MSPESKAITESMTRSRSRAEPEAGDTQPGHGTTDNQRDHHGDNGTALQDSVPVVIGEVSSAGARHGRPVTTSTGLGLPLCRSFALAGGGWASIEDSKALEKRFNKRRGSRGRGSLAVLTSARSLGSAIARGSSEANSAGVRASLSGTGIGIDGSMNVSADTVVQVSDYTQLWAVMAIEPEPVAELPPLTQKQPSLLSISDRIGRISSSTLQIAKAAVAGLARSRSTASTRRDSAASMQAMTGRQE